MQPGGKCVVLFYFNPYPANVENTVSF